MTIDGSETSPPPDHILGWIGDSISCFPTIFDNPYGTGDFSGDSWWDQSHGLEQLISSSFSSFNTPAADSITTTEAEAEAGTTTSVAPTPATSLVSNHSLSKKRKLLRDGSTTEAPRKSLSRRVQVEEAAAAAAATATEQDSAAAPRELAATKKGNKSAGNGSNRERRWAEQLLNPCAAAITAQDPSRVQHFLYVLHDLASLNGDANHRLAFHGLRAITHHLSGASGSSFASSGNTFASSNPRFFSNSLLKFNDINPWFRIPNNVANTSILQILGEQEHPTNLHILDIGVSHGLQWPTLLEELTRRAGGPPPLVRLTVVPPPTSDEESRNATPFADGPQNYDFATKLISFAKDLNVNLQINKMKNFHLQTLNSQMINSTADETLVVCAQFRLHNLNHNAPDDRTQFLRVLRSLQPKGVILSENNTDCSCISCGDFTTSFSRRVEYLWKFLDSTSIAYKGRESDERRMIEAEAAKVLINAGEMNERKEQWCERMKNAGFKGEMLGEDTVDGARALLRKYDSNWEIRIEEKDACFGLWWKGQPVSFCSLWKTDVRVKECMT